MWPVEALSPGKGNLQHSGSNEYQTSTKRVPQECQKSTNNQIISRTVGQQSTKRCSRTAEKKEKKRSRANNSRRLVAPLCVCDGQDLLGHHGQDRQTNAVEFVETTPQTRLAQSFEDFGHVFVGMVVRAIRDDHEDAQRGSQIFHRFRFAGAGRASGGTTQPIVRESKQPISRALKRPNLLATREKPRNYETTRLREYESTRVRNNETTRLRNNETTRLRNNETTHPIPNACDKVM